MVFEEFFAKTYSPEGFSALYIQKPGVEFKIFLVENFLHVNFLEIFRAA